MILLTLITTLDRINGDYLEELMLKYSDKLYSIAYSMLREHGKENGEDAEDLVQETFLKVYMNIGRFNGLSEEDTIKLLVVYTKNTVKDYLKRAEHKYKKMSLAYEDEGEEKIYDIPDTEPTPEEFVIKMETVKNTAGYIDRLTEEQRQVILLKYQYGYRNKDIAQALCIPETNVSSRLNRAKSALKKMMEAE